LRKVSARADSAGTGAKVPAAAPSAKPVAGSSNWWSLSAAVLDPIVEAKKGSRGCVVASARGRAVCGPGRAIAAWSLQSRGISPPKTGLPEGLAGPSPTAVFLTSLRAWPAAGSWSPLGVESIIRAGRNQLGRPRYTPTGTSAEHVGLIADRRALTCLERTCPPPRCRWVTTSRQETVRDLNGGRLCTPMRIPERARHRPSRDW
jgi:hypothetical protein